MWDVAVGAVSIFVVVVASKVDSVASQILRRLATMSIMVGPMTLREFVSIFRVTVLV